MQLLLKKAVQLKKRNNMKKTTIPKGSKTGVGGKSNPNPSTVFDHKCQYGGPVSAKIKSMIHSKLEL